jgi:excisionase family DNA binding protein
VVKGEGGSGGKLVDVTCEYYTPNDVAIILNLSPDMVYDLLREGQLPAIRLGSGRRQLWRIPIREFRWYLAAIRTGPLLDLPPAELPETEPDAGGEAQ